MEDKERYEQYWKIKIVDNNCLCSNCLWNGHTLVLPAACWRCCCSCHTYVRTVWTCGCHTAATQAEQNQHPSVTPVFCQTDWDTGPTNALLQEVRLKKGWYCMTADPQRDSHMSQNNSWKDVASKTIFLFILMTKDQLPLSVTHMQSLTCVKKRQAFDSVNWNSKHDCSKSKGTRLRWEMGKQKYWALECAEGEAVTEANQLCCHTEREYYNRRSVSESETLQTHRQECFKMQY